MDHIRRVVIGLGSNLGDRFLNVDRALERMKSLEDVHVLEVSPWYETDPMGGPPQGAFINGAALLVTALDAAELMERLLQIETDLGRVRGEKNAPRIVDLDILWIEGECVSRAELQVPHPRLTERAFALRPLLDVAPDASHAESGLVYADLPLAKLDLPLAQR